MVDYDKTVKDVQDLLRKNDEWKQRYAGYIASILPYESNSDSSFENDAIREATKKFKVPGQFTLHMSVSKAKEAKESKVEFDLRFHGHNVGLLKVSKGKVELKICKNDDIISAIKKFDGTAAENLMKLIGNQYDWSSDEAVSFRKIYASLEKAIGENGTCLTRNKEHELESILLKNFSQTRSCEKIICNIQPVTMLQKSLFFQMPTPLKASKAKSGSIDYAAEKGGGIDILARIGGGNGTYLAIIELKDKFENSEQPKDAICQGIAYATFIRELLRSESGKEWWKFFGFGGCIPKALKLYAIIAMPNNANADTKFVYDSEPKGKELLLGKNDENYKNDKLELGYIYLESDGLPQKISENLPLENNKKNS